MKETMTIPAPGPQKSCYPPSERFSRYHEVVTIHNTRTKHIDMNVKELYLCVIHKKTVQHLNHKIEIIRQYNFFVIPKFQLEHKQSVTCISGIAASVSISISEALHSRNMS